MENEERAVLLDNLYAAAAIIKKAEDTTQAYNDLMSRIKRMRRKREYVDIDKRITTKGIDFLKKVIFWVIAAPLILIFAIGAVLSVTSGNMSMSTLLRGLFSILIIIVIPIYLIRKIMGKGKTYWRAMRDQRGREATAEKNRQIDEENARIEAENALILQQAEVVEQEMAQVRALADQRLKGWYPPKYCYSHAVNYFISAVENYQADTIGAAVNLYIEEMRHQEHMEKMDTLNMLTAMNLFTNMQIRDAIHENTAAIHAEGDRITGAIHQNTNAVHQNTNAVYQTGQRVVDAANKVSDSFNRMRRGW